MAPATQLACALALAGIPGVGWATDNLTPRVDTSLPSSYVLSYDKDKWTDDFSVFRMAVADRFGVLGSGFAASDDPRLRPLTRLDSSWMLNSPFLPLPTRVGDSVSSVGFWDQPTRIGGIQMGTFQPREAAVIAPPSLVALPYETVGPAFTSTRFIDHLRTLVQLQSESLATAGQGDFSVESGRVRENFELRSADYGPWITSGTYRYGITGTTTVDGQVAQVSGQQSFVGVGVLEGLGSLGVVSAKIANSHDPDASGWVAKMAYDYSRDNVSFAVRSHIQSLGFQEVGDTSTVEPVRQRTLASARVDLGSLGKLSLASATQTYADDSRRDLVAMSHAIAFGGGGIISTAAAYSPGQFANSALLLSFTYPFDYLEAPSRTVGAVNTALDRTIDDAFGQTRLPATARAAIDK